MQLAKAFGAEVTGVCSTPNVDLVRSLGADHVIDYKREDFTRNGRRYDLIIDNVGNRPLLACRRAMGPNARLVVVGAPDGRWVAPVVRVVAAKLLSQFGSRKFVPHLTDTTQADLVFLAELLEAGTISPVIDRRYPLSEVPDAIRYLETMRARGNRRRYPVRAARARAPVSGPAWSTTVPSGPQMPDRPAASS